MKNQYFGDINDYYKYGLLRILAREGNIQIAVCWMLTPDTNSVDGELRDYLGKPVRYRGFDPDLFDCLAKYKDENDKSRNVCQAEVENLIPGARYYKCLVPDDSIGRADFFRSFLESAQGTGLLFFDPDNGLEVKSCPYGRKRSSKYLYWPEVCEAWSGGYSLLVYQHYPREKRGKFIERMRQKFCRTLNIPDASLVIPIGTIYAVFFLVLQSENATKIAALAEAYQRRWNIHDLPTNPPSAS